eukprot:987535-Amorphochlora_amoeboformis.AAC.2
MSEMTKWKSELAFFRQRRWLRGSERKLVRIGGRWARPWGTPYAHALGPAHLPLGTLLVNFELALILMIAKPSGRRGP